MNNRLKPQSPFWVLLGTLMFCLLPNWFFAQNTAVATGGVFRGGANKNGVYAGSDFNSISHTKWQFKTGAAVRSTPLVDQGKVYAGSADGFLYCLDAGTGKKLWAFQAGFAINSSPAMSKDKVFFTNKKNQLFALNKLTGQKIWQSDLQADLPYAWGFDYYQSSPLVQAGTVYVGSGSGAVFALNEADGKIKWNFKTASLVRSSPALAQNTLYFGDLSGKVYALDAASGAKKWQFATNGDTINNERFGNDFKAILASVAIKDNIAVIGGRDGYLYAINASTGQEIWHYSFNGSWVISSVAIKDSVVVMGTSDGRVVKAFNLFTGKEKWTHATPTIVWSSPIIVGNTVAAVVNDGFMHILDFQTGAEKSRYRFGDRTFSSPVIANGVIYVGNDDGNISALQTATKTLSGRPIKKAVFWTSDVMGKYLRAGMSNLIRDYFVAEGYELLSDQTLPAFLQANSSANVASVVVFAAGYFQEEIITGAYHNSLLYHYLSKGGKVVALGTNPAFHKFDYSAKEYRGLSYMQADTLIGVKYPYNDLRSHYGLYSSLPTETGKKWGLTQTVSAFAGVDPAQVTPLALDENGKAVYWVKNYGQRQGTGFVQLWMQANTLHLLGEVKKIAEYGIE